MTVDLPDEVVIFMKDLARKIKDQDNRMTRPPYFYVVQGTRQYVAPEGYGDGEVHYYKHEWEMGGTREYWELFLKNHDEENGSKTDIDEFLATCEAFGMHDIWEEDNVFLTEDGYKRHMEFNGHNDRHLKDVHSYVKYAGRNPEMEGLLKAIMAFGGKEGEGKR